MYNVLLSAADYLLMTGFFSTHVIHEVKREKSDDCETFTRKEMNIEISPFLQNILLRSDRMCYPLYMAE